MYWWILMLLFVRCVRGQFYSDVFVFLQRCSVLSAVTAQFNHPQCLIYFITSFYCGYFLLALLTSHFIAAALGCFLTGFTFNALALCFFNFPSVLQYLNLFLLHLSPLNCIIISSYTYLWFLLVSAHVVRFSYCLRFLGFYGFMWLMFVFSCCLSLCKNPCV